MFSVQCLISVFVVAWTLFRSFSTIQYIVYKCLSPFGFAIWDDTASFLFRSYLWWNRKNIGNFECFFLKNSKKNFSLIQWEQLAVGLFFFFIICVWTKPLPSRQKYKQNSQEFEKSESILLVCHLFACWTKKKTRT